MDDVMGVVELARVVVHPVVDAVSMLDLVPSSTVSLVFTSVILGHVLVVAIGDGDAVAKGVVVPLDLLSVAVSCVLVVEAIIVVEVRKVIVDKDIVLVEEVLEAVETRLVVDTTVLDNGKGGGMVPLRYKTLGNPSVLLQKQPCRKVNVPSCRSATI
jgi:hypothetical protein